MSTDSIDLISKLLKHNPNDRLSLEGVMKHHWIIKNAKSIEQIKAASGISSQQQQQTPQQTASNTNAATAQK
jgi:serine/threonine protein kinase